MATIKGKLKTQSGDTMYPETSADKVIGLSDTYVTKNTAQEVSGKKSFTQKPVFKETTVLPSGYQQVKYITASGTQYIDTGYKQTTEKMKVEFACSFPYPTGGMSLFGSNSNYDLVPYSSGNYAFSHWVGSSGGIVPVTYDPDYNEATYILDNGSLSLNLNGATSTGTYSGTIINNHNFFIFGKNGAGSSGERGNGYRLYFLKLYDNGTLVRNLVPCYRESDNEIGLYDLVGNTFYPNSGSGTFAKGGKIGESPFATEEDLSLCVKSVNSTSPDSNGNVSITIPSYESKTAASGGTAVSLVTTGEKYTWNNKANLSGGNTFSGDQVVSGLLKVGATYPIISSSAGNGVEVATSVGSSTYYKNGTIIKRTSTSTAYTLTLPSKTATLATLSDIPATATSVISGSSSHVTSGAVYTALENKVDKATLTTKGDIYYASAASTPARLGIGSQGQVLTVGSSGVPTWQNPSSGSSGKPTFDFINQDLFDNYILSTPDGVNFDPSRDSDNQDGDLEALGAFVYECANDLGFNNLRNSNGFVVYVRSQNGYTEVLDFSLKNCDTNDEFWYLEAEHYYSGKTRYSITVSNEENLIEVMRVEVPLYEHNIGIVLTESSGAVYAISFRLISQNYSRIDTFAKLKTALSDRFTERQSSTHGRFEFPASGSYVTTGNTWVVNWLYYEPSNSSIYVVRTLGSTRSDAQLSNSITWTFGNDVVIPLF